MTAPDQSAWPDHARLSSGEPLSAGNPVIFDPEFVSGLSRREQRHVDGAYDYYLNKHRGMYQSSESRHATPASMARQVIAHGVWGAAWFRTIPIVIVLVYVGTAMVMDGSPIAVVLASVSILVIVVLGYRMWSRVRRVLAMFDVRHPTSK